MGETKKLTKGQKTANKILEAASRCIAQIGVEKTSFTTIAKEADVKRSLVAYHFPKKDQIFYKVMFYIINQLTEKFESDQNFPKGRKGVIYVLDTYMDFFQNNNHYFICFIHCFYLASYDDVFKQLNTEISQRGMTRIRQKVIEMVQEENIPVNEEHMTDFSKLVFMRLIGSSLSFNTTINEQSYAELKASWFSIFEHELNLFLSFTKSH